MHLRMFPTCSGLLGIAQRAGLGRGGSGQLIAPQAPALSIARNQERHGGALLDVCPPFRGRQRLRLRPAQTRMMIVQQHVCYTRAKNRTVTSMTETSSQEKVKRRSAKAKHNDSEEVIEQRASCGAEPALRDDASPDRQHPTAQCIARAA
ncbi:hypothetical protein U1Q18_044718 [Sarracenia purpurea var. burkii]